MLPKSWKPKNSHGLVRVGPDADGGYVISQVVLGKTKILFGLGVSDNWLFEEDFQKRSGCKVICYDHTVNAKFWRRRFKKDLAAFLSLKRLTPRKFKDIFKYISYKRFFDGDRAIHHKLMIGYDGSGSTSISSIIKNHGNDDMFFKIDIEGSEYRVIDQLIGHRDSLLGLVIELHDVDVHRDRISNFIEKFEGYSVVHIHANNYGEKVDNNGDPLTIELTFLRDDLVSSDLVEEQEYPIDGLDFPNNPRRSDIPLKFE